jgi:hypothetical protein
MWPWGQLQLVSTLHQVQHLGRAIYSSITHGPGGSADKISSLEIEVRLVDTWCDTLKIPSLKLLSNLNMS